LFGEAISRSGLPLEYRMEHHLRHYFEPFGHVESCVAYTTMAAAMIIFSTPDAAARALRDRLALDHSWPAPRDDQVVDYLRLLRFRMLLLTRDVSNLMEEAGPLAYEDALPVDLANDLLLPGPPPSCSRVSGFRA
jgi:hypothetical protein